MTPTSSFITLSVSDHQNFVEVIITTKSVSSGLVNITLLSFTKNKPAAEL